MIGTSRSRIGASATGIHLMAGGRTGGRQAVTAPRVPVVMKRISRRATPVERLARRLARPAIVTAAVGLAMQVGLLLGQI